MKLHVALNAVVYLNDTVCVIMLTVFLAQWETKLRWMSFSELEIVAGGNIWSFYTKTKWQEGSLKEEITMGSFR